MTGTRTRIFPPWVRQTNPEKIIDAPKNQRLIGGKMKSVLAVVLCISVSSVALAGDTGYTVKYDGGSIQEIKAGTDLKLYIGENAIRFRHDKQEVITIPPSAVTEVSYGQDVHRRVGTAIGLAVVSLGIGALMALSKSKKHYVGLTWENGEKKGGLAMQCDKKRVPGYSCRTGRCDRQESCGHRHANGQELRSYDTDLGPRRGGTKLNVQQCFNIVVKVD
jgi:hypothetical protein